MQVFLCGVYNSRRSLQNSWEFTQKNVFSEPLPLLARMTGENLIQKVEQLKKERGYPQARKV